VPVPQRARSSRRRVAEPLGGSGRAFRRRTVLRVGRWLPSLAGPQDAARLRAPARRQLGRAIVWIRALEDEARGARPTAARPPRPDSSPAQTLQPGGRRSDSGAGERDSVRRVPVLFTGDAHYDYGLELLGAFGEEDFRTDVLKPPTMAARAEPGAACSRRQGPPSRSPRPPMRVVTGSRRTHWTGALVAALSALTAQRLLARVRPASWCWQTRGARG
jgi:hypothetical protein